MESPNGQTLSAETVKIDRNLTELVSKVNSGIEKAVSSLKPQCPVL